MIAWWYERKYLRVQAWYLYAIKPRWWWSNHRIRKECLTKIEAVTWRVNSEANTHRMDWSQPGGVRRVPW